MRRLVLLLSVLLVGWAAVTVPLPYEQTVPGIARPVEDLVTVGVADAEVNGDLELLTVRERRATVADALLAAVRTGDQLRPVGEDLPPGLDEEVLREVLAQQFANSFTTAVAVAADSAGYPVEPSTQVVVASVVDGGPSDGTLLAGDVVTRIGDVTVDSELVLRDELGRSGVGDELELAVRRDGDELELDVTLGELPGGQAGLGILPITLTAPVELPFDVQLAESNIIGPSAGLMIAVTVVDLLSDVDYAAGRVVAGTGSIDGTGAVGTIGGMPQKVETALANGADLLLVPAPQLEEATAAAAGRIPVIGVDTLDEALDALVDTAP